MMTTAARRTIMAGMKPTARIPSVPLLLLSTALAFALGACGGGGGNPGTCLGSAEVCESGVSSPFPTTSSPTLAGPATSGTTPATSTPSTGSGTTGSLVPGASPTTPTTGSPTS
jgi:hypothetical protein